MAKIKVGVYPKWYKLNFVTLSICFYLVVGSATAAEITDHFSGPTLDTVVWDPCQADVVNLIGFGETTVGGSKKRFLINKIDETREDADCVSTGASDALLSSLGETDVLGPSLVFPRTPAFLNAGLLIVPPTSAIEPDNQCVEAETRYGRPITQRNELRFRNRKIHSHRAGDAHWYSIAFKMEGTIPTCGSVRWVLAQWKYFDRQWHREFPQSPFLAQRFDNGVFHITVQNGRCRCMVAKTHGDPNKTIAASVANFAASPTDAAKLKPVSPVMCVLTGGGPGDGTTCEPIHFRMYALDASQVPDLPDPRRDWVKMMYHVKAGGEGDGRIDIYANNRFIVRVDGVIGYPGGTPGRVKFKYGHYRDKIPGEAKMLVDELCVSVTASKCDRNIRTVK